MSAGHTPSAVWHPFTQHGLLADIPEIVAADGAYLTLQGGQRVFDAIASWWVITHGHRHPRLVAALKAAAEGLDQVMFAGFTHEPAERLAQSLIGIAPRAPASPPLEHVFYTDSGSTAVEVAVKMALSCWRNRGARGRTRIGCLEHGYHGDTVSAMSLGHRGVFNEAYAPLLHEVVRLPFPHPGREAETLEAFARAAGMDELAAIIVEPLVLGAGGMLMYPAEVLLELRAIATRHDVLLIADEVMTGFGRTGTMFACSRAGIAPDIVCLAKGLTGGTLPLAATLATADVFDAHRSDDRARMFFHSSSFTANPIACAVAQENLAIWRDEPVMERITALASAQAQALDGLRDSPLFGNIRQAGTITAFEIAGSGQHGYLATIGPRLAALALAEGVLVRPLGATVYVMAPYCTTAADLAHVYAVIAGSAARLAREG